jgi:hypothetical protein
MQIEAIYDSGTLLLPAIRLKHSRLKLQVIIPDDEIVDEQAELVVANRQRTRGSRRFAHSR